MTKHTHTRKTHTHMHANRVRAPEVIWNMFDVLFFSFQSLCMRIFKCTNVLYRETIFTHVLKFFLKALTKLFCGYYGSIPFHPLPLPHCSPLMFECRVSWLSNRGVGWSVQGLNDPSNAHFSSTHFKQGYIYNASVFVFFYHKLRFLKNVVLSKLNVVSMRTGALFKKMLLITLATFLNLNLEKII